MQGKVAIMENYKVSRRKSPWQNVMQLNWLPQNTAIQLHEYFAKSESEEDYIRIAGKANSNQKELSCIQSFQLTNSFAVSFLNTLVADLSFKTMWRHKYKKKEPCPMLLQKMQQILVVHEATWRLSLTSGFWLCVQLRHPIGLYLYFSAMNCLCLGEKFWTMAGLKTLQVATCEWPAKNRKVKWMHFHTILTFF